jgi:WD40 repeat protein
VSSHNNTLQFEIDRPQDGVYPVRITTPAGAQDRGMLILPQGDARFAELLAQITARDPAVPFDDDAIIELGRRLYHLLINGPTAILFHAAITQAFQTHTSLQINLSFEAADELLPVAAIPWEFLSDDAGYPLVARHSLTRSIRRGDPIPPLTINEPIRMLLVWALPTDLASESPLKIEDEVIAIQDQLRPLMATAKLDLMIVPQATMILIQQAISDYKPHIVHLIAHGLSNMRGDPMLVLNDKYGRIAHISPRQLSIIVSNRETRLVVLNACHSGSQGTSTFRSFGAALLSAQIPAIVGMQASVLDGAGALFAQELYRTLIGSGSIDAAVQEGRKAILSEDIGRIDWGLVTLYLRAQNGILFQRQGAAPAPAASTPPALSRVRRPDRFIERPLQTAALREALLVGWDHRQSSRIVALRGLGGFGKTVLAQAACHDEAVQRAFPDGILWVEFGEQPDLVGAISILLRSLLGGEPKFSNLDDGVFQLAGVLAHRHCLIVLDDVWSASSMAPFVAIESASTWLITTSRRDIALDARTVQVDEMTQEQSVALLISRLVPRPRDMQIFRPLVQRLGEWPLLLELASAAIQYWVVAGMTPEQALAQITEEFSAYGVQVFDRDDEDIRQGAIGKTLDASLRRLKEDITHYLALAIFPEDVAIPVVTANKLWEVRLPLLLAQKFARFSLLMLDVQAHTIRLHDAIRAYLFEQVRDQWAALHQRFLDMYRSSQGAPLHPDAYLSRYRLYHLHEGGLDMELANTASDLSILIARIIADGAAAALQDLRYASEHLPHNTQLAALYRSLSLIPQFFAHHLTHHEIAHMLIARLLHLPELRPNIEAILSGTALPILLPWHPLPDLPSPALVQVLTGHMASVTSCAISADRTLVVSGSWDATVRIWDIPQGATRLVLRGHEAPVLNCAISADGATIVSSSHDQTLRVWDVATGTLRAVLRGHTASVMGCAISHDGATIVSSSADQTVRVWDSASGATRFVLNGHTREVWRCAMSADSSSIVSVSADQTIRIWDARQGVIRHVLTGHTDRVTGCAISDNGATVVSASADTSVRVWDGHGGTQRHVLAGHTLAVWSCAISADGATIISGSSDQTIRVWDAQGELIQVLSGHAGGVEGCAISADGRLAVSASIDQTLRIWDVRTTVSPVDVSAGHSRVTDCALSSDARGALAISADGTAWAWDAQKGTVCQRLSIAANRVGCISPDGQTMLTAGADRTLQIWDSQLNSPHHVLSGHTEHITTCEISPNGAFAVSGSWDTNLCVWDMQTGGLLHVLSGHPMAVSACCMSADGSTILSVSDDGTVRAWDTAAGGLLYAWAGHTKEARACGISADASVAVSGSWDTTLCVWDLRTGALRHRLMGHAGEVIRCAISRDGTTIMSAGADQTIRVWDAGSGTQRHMIKPHADHMTGCVLSSDGTLIVSTSSDCTLRVWDARSGQQIAIFIADGRIHTCSIAADGRSIIAGGDKGLYWLQLVRSLDQVYSLIAAF